MNLEGPVWVGEGGREGPGALWLLKGVRRYDAWQPSPPKGWVDGRGPYERLVCFLGVGIRWEGCGGGGASAIFTEPQPGPRGCRFV